MAEKRQRLATLSKSGREGLNKEGKNKIRSFLTAGLSNKQLYRQMIK